tara:strand:- start:25 stop:1080 length:1056 start_codon:yes stop_codon:yes gene_type:complete
MAAYTTVNKSTNFFNTKIYTGNGGTNAITGVGFQPDMIWCKARSYNDDHTITDAVRGNTKVVYPNSSNAEATSSSRVTAFGTDGFTLGASGDVNSNSSNYVSWNWKAGTGQGSSNTDGSINTTYTSVNTTSGVSISKYDGTGSGATVGHGLGATPKMIMWKRLDNNAGTTDWLVQSPIWANRNKLILNTNEALAYSSTYANVDNWSNSVFTLGTHAAQNASNGTYIAYAFAEVRGFSKFGTFAATNHANGPLIYTGFKPGLVIFKRTDSTGNWHMYDNKRAGYNELNYRLRADTNEDEESSSNDLIDIVSNGIKIRSNQTSLNNHTGTVMYMAFAAEPLVDSTGSTPATAR